MRTNNLINRFSVSIIAVSCLLVQSSCGDNQLSTESHGPIILGDSTTIVTETDSQYLQNMVLDIDSQEEAKEQATILNDVPKDTLKKEVIEAQLKEEDQKIEAAALAAGAVDTAAIANKVANNKAETTSNTRSKNRNSKSTNAKETNQKNAKNNKKVSVRAKR